MHLRRAIHVLLLERRVARLRQHLLQIDAEMRCAGHHGVVEPLRAEQRQVLTKLATARERIAELRAGL